MFPCSMCGQSFYDPANLQRHMAMSHVSQGHSQLAQGHSQLAQGQISQGHPTQGHLAQEPGSRSYMMPVEPKEAGKLPDSLDL